MNLFAYGTLLDRTILDSLVHGEYEAVPAVLEGYARLRVQGETYPGLVERAGMKIDGVAYLGLSAGDILRLDEFEGGDYKRKKVKVRDADGREFEAQVYIFQSVSGLKLSEDEWDYAEFVHSGRAQFLADYPGFNREAP